MKNSTSNNSAEKANNMTLKILLFSVLLGIAATFLINGYVQKRIKGISGGQMTSIIIADKMIKQGDVIEKAMLGKRAMPSKYMHYNAVREHEALSLLGQRAVNDIPEGTPVLFTDIEIATQISLADRLTPGYRAMSINLSSTDSVSGFIRPGDRIDVQLTHNDGKSGTATRSLLQNITVIAVNGKTSHALSKKDAKSSGATDITLNLSPEDAAILTLAESVGSIRLLLRNANDIVIKQMPLTFADALSNTQSHGGSAQPKDYPHVYKGKKQLQNLYLPQNLQHLQKLRNALETQQNKK